MRYDIGIATAALGLVVAGVTVLMNRRTVSPYRSALVRIGWTVQACTFVAWCAVLGTGWPILGGVALLEAVLTGWALRCMRECPACGVISTFAANDVLKPPSKCRACRRYFSEAPDFDA
jgi:hypothetical protein